MSFLIQACFALSVFALVSAVILGVVNYAQSIDRREFRPCCPPGVGCNDGQNRLCRRSMAMRLADFEEGVILDRRWIAFNSAPPWRPWSRAKALRKYALERDSIIDSRMQRIGQDLQDFRQAQIEGPSDPMVTAPSHVEVFEALSSDKDMRRGLRGEVLDP